MDRGTSEKTGPRWGRARENWPGVGARAGVLGRWLARDGITRNSYSIVRVLNSGVLYIYMLIYIVGVE